MKTPFFKGSGDRIMLAAVLGIVALMLIGVGFVTGRAQARIAQERLCREVRLECLARDRGYVVEPIKR